MKEILWEDCCGKIAVGRLLWEDCCGKIAVGRLVIFFLFKQMMHIAISCQGREKKRGLGTKPLEIFQNCAFSILGKRPF